MKKKILLSSVLIIVLCVSLIAGSTFALFTKDTTANIAVTSGFINIKATIDKGKVSTQSEGDESAFSRNDGSFENGGSAKVDPLDPSKLIISGMTPGDAVRFNIGVVNKSNIAVQYRVVWRSGQSDTPVDLADALTVTVKVNDETLDASDKTSDYYRVGPGDTITNFEVTLTFPYATNNDTYQGANANLAFTVEAIQGNGDALATNP